jgi:hypothetical protein
MSNEIVRNKKFVLTANLAPVSTLENAEKLKEVLKIPEEKERQPDLSYLSAVLVSSGMNLNGAYFLPHELVSAFESIKHKPFNIEHEGQSIVGHMYDAVLVDRDANVLDVADLKTKDIAELDKIQMDIVILAVLYKDQFPEVAADVKDGKYGVSMECYYSHYDIIIGDVIIPADAAGFLNVDESASKDFNLVHGDKTYATVTVGRVLRNILFCGIGFVETPANVRSIILEAAKVEEEEDENIEELSHIDIATLPPSLVDKSKLIRDLVHSNFEVSFAIYTGAHDHDFADSSNVTVLGGGHGHGIVNSDVPEGYYVCVWDGGYHQHKVSLDSQKTGTDSDNHVHIISIDDGSSVTLIESSPPVKKHSHELLGTNRTNYGGSHSHYIEMPNGKKIRTIFGKRSLKKFLKERNMSDVKEVRSVAANTLDGGGPGGGTRSTNPKTCVNFKKYVYEFMGSENPPITNIDDVEEFIPAPTLPGAGDTVTQNMRIIHTNWCSLFDTECTTLGGDATHPDCLRNVLNRTTKERLSTYRDMYLDNYDKMQALVKKINKVVDQMEASVGDAASEDS